MPRAQNAHAVVNAGFLFKLDNKGNVLERPNIIFGGIRPDFVSRFIFCNLSFIVRKVSMENLT